MKRGFLVNKITFDKRETVFDDQLSPLLHEEMSITIKFISSGQTNYITNEEISKKILKKINFIKF